MTTNEQILARMRSHGTLLCVGLDPDLRKLPNELLNKSATNEERVLEFLQGVIDATGPHVCVYKAQKAFFDLLPGGHDVLKEIVHYVHQTQVGVPIIIDCKIGDIDNTMAVYIENLFSLIQADGVVVNPYMGDDVIMPLMEYADKAIVVLVKTSNISGSVMQDVEISDGRPFWQYLLDMVVNRWNENGNMIPVLSSTVKLDIAELRLLIPDTMPILFAGIGVQGGSYESLRNLLNSEGIGTFVNSSRGILYPKNSKPWRKAIEVEAIGMKNALNEVRGIS